MPPSIESPPATSRCRYTRAASRAFGRETAAMSQRFDRFTQPIYRPCELCRSVLHPCSLSDALSTAAPFSSRQRRQRPSDHNSVRTARSAARSSAYSESGIFARVAGGPSSTMRPSSSTRTRSNESVSSMSWVTHSSVCSRHVSRARMRSSWRLARSRPRNGSSRSASRTGCLTSARPKRTR